MSNNRQDGLERQKVPNASGHGWIYAKVDQNGFIVGGDFGGIHVSELNTHDPKQQPTKPFSSYRTH